MGSDHRFILVIILYSDWQMPSIVPVLSQHLSSASFELELRGIEPGISAYKIGALMTKLQPFLKFSFIHCNSSIFLEIKTALRLSRNRSL